MDKYEYGIKCEQIKKALAMKDYEKAADIADDIDWRKVKDNAMISRVAEAYEGNKEYMKAKEVLLIAYERSPLGRQLAYKLTLLSLRVEDYEEAEEFYADFVEMSPMDVAQYLLKYRIARAKGAGPEELAQILEAYVEVEKDERWQYELAKLYHELGRINECIDMCDDIYLWFNEGKYVIKALKLKRLHSELTIRQQATLSDYEDADARKTAKTTMPTMNTEPSGDGKNTYAGEQTGYVETAYAGEPSGYAENMYVGEQTGYEENTYAGEQTGYEENTYAGEQTGYVESAYAEEQTGYAESAYAGEQTGYVESAYAGEQTGYEESAYAGEQTGYVESAYAGEQTGYEENTYAGEQTGYVENFDTVTGAGDVPSADDANPEEESDSLSRELEQREILSGNTLQNIIIRGKERERERELARKKHEEELRLHEPLSNVREIDESERAGDKELKAEQTDSAKKDERAGSSDIGANDHVSRGVTAILQGLDDLYDDDETENKYEEPKMKAVFTNHTEQVKNEEAVDVPDASAGLGSDVSGKIEVDESISDDPAVIAALEAVRVAEEAAKRAQEAAMQARKLAEEAKLRALSEKEVTQKPGPREVIEIFEFDKEKEGKGAHIGEELTKTAEIDIDAINMVISRPDNVYDTANLQGIIAQGIAELFEGENLEKPVEEPVEEIAEPVEELVEEPLEEVAEPVEELVEEPVEEIAAEPIEELVEEPVEEPVEEKAAEPVEVVEKVTEEPAEVVEEPIEKVAAEPVEELVEEAIEEAAEPIEELLEEPVEDIAAEPVEVVEEAIEKVAAEPVEELVEEAIEEVAQPAEVAKDTDEEPFTSNAPTKIISREEINRVLQLQQEAFALGKEVLEEEKKADEEVKGQISLDEFLGDMEPKTTIVKPIDDNEITGEPAQESVKEAVEEPAKEVAVEPIEEAAEETVEEPVKEAVEETAEGPVKEAVEETAEELVKEAAEETAQEPVKEAVEETAEGPVEEAAEEPAKEVAEENRQGSPSASDSPYDEIDFSMLKEHKLPEEIQQMFGDINSVEGMDEKIADVLDNLIENFVVDGTSKTNNLIVTGGAKSGKTTLALGVIKAANRGRKRQKRKVAKVKATALNKRGVSTAMMQILGTDLIIEQAGNLMPNTVVDLITAMKAYTEEMLIVLEDEKVAIDRMLDNIPELENMFNNRLDIPEFELEDMCRIAVEYARSEHYRIDELGNLALHAKLADVSGRNQGISFEEIEEIVDEAIEHSNRFTIGKLFGKIGKRKGTMNVLTEEDFL